ncbi:MAG: Holliday junction branch migration DNA helicase RuvB, partial [Patescibacteria group bacterium]
MLTQKNNLPRGEALRGQPEDAVLDQTLRPSRLEDYIGQNQIKENLKIFLSAAQKRNESIEHILLYGPA